MSTAPVQPLATQQQAAVRDRGFRPVCIDGTRGAAQAARRAGAAPAPATQALRRALVVEDDHDVARLLCEALSRAGFETTRCDDGLSAITAAREHDPELITMDLSIEGMDGFETIRQLRAFSDAHVIIVSSLTDEPDIVQSFATGADDFVCKPLRAREFRAHLDAYLRRAGDSHLERAGLAAGAKDTAPDMQATTLVPASSECGDAWIERAGLAINTVSREVAVDGQPVQLTKSEFDLLHALLTSGRRVRSKASLALELRSGQQFLASHVVTDADRRAVEVHMANLRKKLGDRPRHPRWISTVRGVGYQLVPLNEPNAA